MASVTDSHQSHSTHPPRERQLSVNRYDQVASLLIAVLILVALGVLMMFIVWLTGRLMFTQTTIPIELLEYAGRGDHAEGFERDMLEPGLEELEEMYEPQVEATLEAVTDIVSTQSAAFDSIANAANATAKGQGGMGDSRGPGPLGEGSSDIIPPWDRWEIRFTTAGITAYARQLDFFKIELGAMGGGSPVVEYAYNLAKPKPDTKTGPPDAEKRLYMSWKGGGPLAAYDKQLLGRAGIKTDRRLVLQFYPKETEMMLLRAEAEAGRDHDPREFLRTIFGVQSARNGFEFYVIDQFYRPMPRS